MQAARRQRWIKAAPAISPAHSAAAILPEHHRWRGASGSAVGSFAPTSARSRMPGRASSSNRRPWACCCALPSMRRASSPASSSSMKCGMAGWSATRCCRAPYRCCDRNSPTMPTSPGSYARFRVSAMQLVAGGRAPRIAGAARSPRAGPGVRHRRYRRGGGCLPRGSSCATADWLAIRAGGAGPCALRYCHSNILGTASDDRYIADGLTEELTVNLSHVERLAGRGAQLDAELQQPRRRSRRNRARARHHPRGDRQRARGRFTPARDHAPVR